MKIENKRSEITELINNIKKHSDHLNELEVIPALEIGVILSKINKLHEETTILKYLCEQGQGERVEAKYKDLIANNIPEEVVTKDETTLPANDESQVDEDAMLLAKENTTDEGLDLMLKATAEEDEVAQAAAVDPESSPTFFTKKKAEDSITESKIEPKSEELPKQSSPLKNALLDPLLEEAKGEGKKVGQAEKLAKKLKEGNDISSKPDVNEAFATEDSSISGHLQKQPIADLMSAIGLNERYLYANDLFDGDMQEFRDAVKMLNEFKNGAEAKAFFESGLRTTYEWKDDNVLAQALFNLLERRYL